MLIESKKLHVSTRCRKIIESKKCDALTAAAWIEPAPDPKAKPDLARAEKHCIKSGGHLFPGALLMPEGTPTPICRFADKSAITIQSLADRALQVAADKNSREKPQQ